MVKRLASSPPRLPPLPPPPLERGEMVPADIPGAKLFLQQQSFNILPAVDEGKDGSRAAALLSRDAFHG